MGVDLGVVIVTHDSEGDLAACLQGLFEHVGTASVAVVLSDAGSTDHTAEVASGFPVEFVPGQNEGFARGANRVLRHPRVCDARYLLFLNPDARITAGSFDALVKLCDSRPGSGIFSVRQVDEHGDLVFNVYRFPNALRLSADVFKSERLRRHGQGCRYPERYLQEQGCDWVNGAFLVVRRQVIDALGGFDGRFFLYSEEVDLCRRARLAGWHVTYLPDMTIEHRQLDSRPPGDQDRLLTVAQIVYARKWFSLPHRVAFRLAIIAKHARRSLDLRGTTASRRKARLRLRGALTLRPGAAWRCG